MNKRLAKLIRKNSRAIVAEWTQNQFANEVLEKWQISWANTTDTPQLSEHFVSPLLGLLIVYVDRGDDNYRQIYLDERLRYAPFNMPQAERCNYFREILLQDKVSITSRIESEEMRQYAVELWDDLHSQLITIASSPVNILAVGDCLMNEIRVFLPSYCHAHGTEVDMRYLYFSAAMNEPLSVGEIADYLKHNNVELMSLSFFTFEGIPLYSILLRECDTLSRKEIDSRVDVLLRQVNSLLQEIRGLTNNPLMVHNVSGLPLNRYRRIIPLLPALSANKAYMIQKLNQGINTVVDNTTNAILLDEHSVGRKHGLRKLTGEVISRKLRRAGYFHTSNFGKPMSALYGEEITRYRAMSRTKLLLVDFDGTLWDGVMADGPVKHFRQRQELLKKLTEVGILLAAVSKNTESNIRWHEMVLQREHFVSMKINWNLKVQSINEVASELSLGLDSFVLIDDNPTERALVQRELPTIHSLDADSEETWITLARLFKYPNTQETEEARNRTKMYQVQVQRQQTLDQKLDYRDLMASLGLEMTFRRSSAKDLKRVHELIARTNQFNTTTRRHSESSLRQFHDQKTSTIFVAELKDKFGSLGVVAVAILTERLADTVEFDTLIMSCRAMGFGLENQFLYEIVTDLSSRYQRFVGLYIPTDRNQPCASVFKQNNFCQIGDSEWEYRVGQSERIMTMDWIRVQKG